MQNNEAATARLFDVLRTYGRVQLTVPTRADVSREQLGLAVLQMLGLPRTYTLAISEASTGTHTIVWVFAPGC